MSDAYATVANGGNHVPATILSKVVFPDRSSTNFGDPPRKRVFSDGETYTATKVLEGVIQSGTGTAANYGCPAAGKTGTAENMDNAWFVGYTPQLSTAVWVGYPQSNNIPMPGGFGGALAAPIWHDYMAQASNGFCGDFPQPTTSWHGTAYFGPHSATGSAGTSSAGNSGNGGNSGSSGSGSPYNNSSLYAQPPQPASPGAATGGGAPSPPQHGGGNGNGNGGGHGGGGGPKSH
jgi:penicillin-binding protein 1A